jgi:hypothetical protein
LASFLKRTNWEVRFLVVPMAKDIPAVAASSCAAKPHTNRAVDHVRVKINAARA